ncbi:MAG: type I secretion system permease/ATPase [Methylococcaceae bacterium]|nr:MAG: type I secretion system permease/ATPase [Methylococcaceae bacterium]
MQPSQARTELFSALLLFRKTFIYTGVFSFIINMLLLTPSIYMLQTYDRVLNSRNVETLVMLTLIVMVFYALIGGLEFARSRALVRVGAQMDGMLNKRVFEAAYLMSLRNGSTNPAQAMQDLGQIRQFLTGQGIFAFFDAPWFPIYLIVIFILSPMLGMIALVGAIILVAMTFLNEKLTHQPLKEAQQEAAAASQFAASNLRNSEVIEAHGMIGHIYRRWLIHNNRVMALQALASDRAGSIMAITKFIRLFQQSLILGAGAYLTLQNEMTSGGMIAASILMGRALSPVELAIASWKQFLVARDANTRLTAMLAAHPHREEGMKLPAPTGKLSVTALMAAPPNSQTLIIKGLSFNVNPGEVVVVIGPSASGKSSLARLLMGIWKPNSGSVRLDGADVYSWDKSDLGNYVGYLPQDVELFNGTVAENIARMGDIDAEKVVEAARRAGVHELVLQFPNGYDTRIGAGGVVLSGGQRQRIALARALYGNPVLVVLDEPNANLDDVGEAALLNAVRQLKAEGRTVLLITHRTSILSVADKIMLIQAGTLTFFSPRDQALATLRGAQAPAAAAAPAPAALPAAS